MINVLLVTIGIILIILGILRQTIGGPSLGSVYIKLPGYFIVAIGALIVIIGFVGA